MAEDQRPTSGMTDASSGGQLPGRHHQPHPTASMSDFLVQIPDSVSNFYLQEAGFNCQDPKITRLVSLAAQKFIADIANDAMAHCRVSQAVKGGGGKAGGGPGGQGNKLTLTMEHLESAMGERGIKVNKPPYYV